MITKYKNKILKKIEDKSLKITIIGAGYVGLPLGLKLAEKQYKVTFLDNNTKILDGLSRGQSHLSSIDSKEIKKNLLNFKFTSNYKSIKNSDFIIICLPTPLTENREPDLSYIKNSMKNLLPNLKYGQAISLESTSYPGTTKDLIVSQLKKFVIGKNFFVIYSPEREDPANKDYNMSIVPKIISGITKNCLIIAKFFYSKIVSKTVPVSSTETAEITKLLENIYRSVNVGLVNEMKQLTDKMGINIFEVVNAAGTKPFGFSKFYPGPGLGGHCIPIDPFYLSWKAKEFNFSAKFIELAGEVNTSMPKWVVNKICEKINILGLRMQRAKILILGLAYKKNVNDLRESPSVNILNYLNKFKPKLYYHDPFFRGNRYGAKYFNMNYKKLNYFDFVVLLTDHDIYDYPKIKKFSKIIFDSRGKFKTNNKTIFLI
jgi:UDP-N-acetyl-D-glucosamine dehydrogenase